VSNALEQGDATTPDDAVAPVSVPPRRSRAKTKDPVARVRFSGDLPRPLHGRVPYAKSREELAGYSDAHIVRDILDSAAWDEVMTPFLAEVERTRQRPGKVLPLYSALELESVLLLQIVGGYETVRETRNALAGDRAEEARRLLGFDRPRPLPGQRLIKLRSGIPSESTLSRYRWQTGEARRLEAYRALEGRLLVEHAATDELRAEADLLDMDGTAIVTHYKAAIYNPDTGLLVNGGLNRRGYPRITAPEAGYNPKLGHAWNLVMVATQTGVPLAWRVVPGNEAETTVGAEVLDELEGVLPLLGERKLRVLSADGGFNAPTIRRRARELGILENIHIVSHDRSSQGTAEAQDLRRIPIEGYRNWSTNGHRELVCRCGNGRSIRRVKLGPKGTTIARVEGHCDTCKSITITSGEWYSANNRPKWRRVNPRDPRQEPELLMGNPLTFNDAVSEQYGNRRFGHNEGLHGALSTRFGLIEGKRWFRRVDQARLAVSMTVCVMHAVAIEQRQRARSSGVAPPLAA
jgi:hypothetical protein